MGSEILVLGIFSNTSALRAIRSVHVWLPPHVEYFKVVKDIPPLDAVCACDLVLASSYSCLMFSVGSGFPLPAGQLAGEVDLVPY